MSLNKIIVMDRHACPLRNQPKPKDEVPSLSKEDKQKTSKNKAFLDFRGYSKYRIAVFLTISLLIVFAAANCGAGGGGGGGGTSSGGISTLGGVSGGSSPVPDPVPLPAPPVEAKKDAYAVMAGVTDYPGTVNDLWYGSKDANDVYGKLYASSMWSGAKFTLLTNSSATKSAIHNAIAEAKNVLSENGTFLFFYSGHGTNSGSTGYMVPYDSLTAGGGIVLENLISGDELNAYLNELPASVKKYVIIDSCRSGYFIDARDMNMISPGEYQYKARFIALSSSSSDYNDENFTKSVVGVPNCYVMTSSRGSELSWESSELGNGVFTYYVCQGLGNASSMGPADINSSGTISAEEMSVYVPGRVSSYVISRIQGYTQTPQSYDGYEGELRVK